LQNRRCQGVVDDDLGPGGVRQFDHRRNVDDVERRVRRSLDQHRLGRTRQGRFPLVEIPPVDNSRFDAVTRREVPDQPQTGDEQAQGRDDAVARFQKAEQRAEGRRHARRNGASPPRPLIFGQTVFEHLGRGVAETTVDLTQTVGLKGGLGLLRA